MHTTPRSTAIALFGWWCWLGIVTLAVTLAAAHGQTIIEIVEQPKNLTTPYYQGTTLSVVARAFTNATVPAPVTYQWMEQNLYPFVHWIEVPGATNATWVIPPSPGCTNTTVLCEIRSGDTYVTSDPARIRLAADCPQLNIVSVEANVPDNEVVVRFDRELDHVSSTNPFNYWVKEIDKTNGLFGIAPFYVQRRDWKSVVLHFESAFGLRTGTRYALQPASDYLRDCCGDWSCSCGMLRDYPDGLPFSTTTTIEILQQPTNVSASVYEGVTFNIVARSFVNGTNPAPLSYQWQVRDPFAFVWNDIFGATNATWIRPPSEECTTEDYRCLIRSGDVFLASDIAHLYLNADCSPLSIISVEGSVANQEVIVRFDQTLDPLNAQDLFNYRLHEHDKTNEIDGLYPDEITMPDSFTVVLHFNQGQTLRSESRYVLFTTQYIVDCCGPRSCGCGILQSYPFGWPFITPSESCAQIIRQPVSTTASLGCRATFEVQAEWLDGLNHLPLRYQWFRNGYPAYGATQRTYATDPVYPGDTNATYYVEVYGACETLRSATVSPVLGTNIEVIQLHSITPGQARDSVIISFAPACNGVIVHLSEAATQSQNFLLNGGLTFRSAYRDCTGTNIILFTSPQQPGSNYTVVVSNITDQSGHLLENGSATGTFTASMPPALPEAGHLQLTTAGQLLVLEWAGGGTLQTTYKADGPWQDLQLAESPLVLLHWYLSCDGPNLTFGTYYRVRWPAAH